MHGVATKKLAAIAYKGKNKIKRQHINYLVAKNKLAAERDDVLASKKDGGDPIVTGSFNKFNGYVF